MNYSAQEVIQYVNEEDVKFIRLTFCDVYGNQKRCNCNQNKSKKKFHIFIIMQKWQ